jgi:hypothetical protein
MTIGKNEMAKAALALELYRKRGNYPKLVGTDWTREGQIAMELALVRCRALDDFLCDKGSKPSNDIYADRDLNYQVSTSYLALPTSFRDAINERTAHLTWSRTKGPLANFQDIGDGVEKYVEYVLAEAFAFLQHITQRPSGIQFIEERHQTYWERLKELHAKLKPQPAPPPLQGAEMANGPSCGAEKWRGDNVRDGVRTDPACSADGPTPGILL